MSGWSFRAGDWYGVFGRRTAVVLPPTSRELAAEVWTAVDAGAGVEETLDVLVSGGLRRLPSFALVAADGDRVTVVVRGEPEVHLAAGGEVVHFVARDATTWVERTVASVTRVHVDTPADPARADPLTGPLTDLDPAAGLAPSSALVRVSSAEHPPAAEEDEEPFVETADHDGRTHLAALEDTGLMPPLPGIPSQPPPPPITARPVARLLFSNGQDVRVDRVVLVGRAPEAGRAATGVPPHLVTVPSPQQEISSTHLEVRPGSGADHGTAVVTDLGSTNGTVLRLPGLPPETLPAGVAVQLVPGAVIDLGDGVSIQVVDP